MKVGTILLIVALMLFSLMIGFGLAYKENAVGLFVVRPDHDFFTCAIKVHGNYQFYYDYGLEEFMFTRNGECCYVNTIQFRIQYIRMFGKTNEVFIRREK